MLRHSFELDSAAWLCACQNCFPAALMAPNPGHLCCAVTVMDVPAGGALATRLEASWFGAPSAPGPPPAEQRGQPQQQRRPRTSDVSTPSDGPMGSARDDDAVETSSAAAESIGRDVRRTRICCAQPRNEHPCRLLMPLVQAWRHMKHICTGTCTCGPQCCNGFLTTWSAEGGL